MGSRLKSLPDLDDQLLLEPDPRRTVANWSDGRNAKIAPTTAIVAITVCKVWRGTC